MDPVTQFVLGAAINGAVTFGVIKATLHFLGEGVKEAKAAAAAAHRRIDEILARWGVHP